jgi:hypothetical protein
MTQTQTLADDVRSFVTFALAMKPDVVIHRRADDDGPRMTLTISAEEAEEEAKIASLEPIMEKYRPLRSYLNALIDSDETIATTKPTTNFQPGLDYRLFRISEAQFQVAKELALRLDRIHVLHDTEYVAEASREYDGLHEYLTGQRQALIGEFKGVTFSNAVATYGSDRLAAAADDDCSGLVIFIVIEIFIG